MSFTHDDVQRIIQLLNTSHFDELHLEADGIKLDLRRHGAGSAASAALAPVAAVASAPVASLTRALDGAAAGAGAASPALAPAQASAATVAGGHLVDIRSPMLGVFYRAPKPGADPFVMPGAVVQPDTVIGIIEVMKLMNSVSADVGGELVEVLVKDGDLVEFDQVLMRVRAVQG